MCLNKYEPRPWTAEGGRKNDEFLNPNRGLAELLRGVLSVPGNLSFGLTDQTHPGRVWLGTEGVARNFFGDRGLP